MFVYKIEIFFEKRQYFLFLFQLQNMRYRKFCRKSSVYFLYGKIFYLIGYFFCSVYFIHGKNTEILLIVVLLLLMYFYQFIFLWKIRNRSFYITDWSYFWYRLWFTIWAKTIRALCDCLILTSTIRTNAKLV